MAVHIEHAEQAIKGVFGEQPLDTRSLQSISCHLNIPIDKDRSSRHELQTAVGCYLHGCPISLEYRHTLHRIAIRGKIDPGTFDFLWKYHGIKLIAKKINEFLIFGSEINESVFHREFSVEITLNYLHDSGFMSLSDTYQRINGLKLNLEAMGFFKKRFEWFDCQEKITSAIDYFSKHSSNGIQVKSKDDLELFFFSSNLTADAKEISFKKISSLYSNRKSRGDASRKQCNFSIDPKTIKLIGSIADKHRISRSELLERVFHPKNLNSLQDLMRLEQKADENEIQPKAL